MVGLNEAITLAVSGHADQTDKAGEAYILHVLRVMLAQSDVEAMTVYVSATNSMKDAPSLRAHSAGLLISASPAARHMSVRESISSRSVPAL